MFTDGFLQMIKEAAPETLPPDPVVEPATPVNGLAVGGAATPAAVAVLSSILSGLTLITWISATAALLYLALLLATRLRHIAHWRLTQHLYELKSGMYAYYVINQGLPRPEPDCAALIAQHFPDAMRTVKNLLPTIAPDSSGHFPSRELQDRRLRHGEFHAALWDTQRLGRLKSSCDQCRRWRVIDRLLWPLPLPG